MPKLLLDIQKLEEAAGRLRAMAHPLRIAIITLLEKHHQLSVTEIYEKLKIEQATASHHLNILKNRGILDSKRDGKNTYYYLRHQVLGTIIECLDRCNSTV